MVGLQRQGCETINLVKPTPLVYNYSGIVEI